MRSDVKAIQITATGQVFGGRTRLRGIILSNATAGAGTITLQDGNSVTQFIGDAPAGDVFAFNIPEDGILFPGGIKVSTITNIEGATLLIDK